MNLRLRSSLAMLAWLAVSRPVDADTVVRIGQTRGGGVNVDVLEMSPLEVKVKQGNVDRTIPVNEIDYITWTGEPATLKNIRARLAAGDYEAVIRTADAIKDDELPEKEMKQDVQFYRAYAKAKLALAGGGDIAEAGVQLREFVNGNPGSYHLLQGAETLGDLFVAVGAFDKATAEYEKLERAPWPDVQARASIALGRAYLAQKKHTEALAAFDKVLASTAASDNAAMKKQLQTAALGKATCLAASQQFEEGIQIIEKIIDEADAEDAELMAKAYVTLGNCYRQKQGATKEAIEAYLHVDILYSSQAECHAEALANLRQLWIEDGKPDRAQQATELLLERYKNSPWAKL